LQRFSIYRNWTSRQKQTKQDNRKERGFMEIEKEKRKIEFWENEDKYDNKK